MAKLRSADAVALAKQFLQLANALTDYRMDNWDDLTPGQRRAMEDAEWSLRNNATDITTYAVGLVLDEVDGSLNGLKTAINKAKRAVKKIAKVKKIIRIATAAVSLAAAIISKNTSAISNNAKSLHDAVTASV